MSLDHLHRLDRFKSADLWDEGSITWAAFTIDQTRNISDTPLTCMGDTEPGQMRDREEKLWNLR